MKKLSTLSLAATLAISTSLWADSLEEAFKNTKVTGELKAAYVRTNFLGSLENDSIFAVGGSLGAVSGDFYGFTLGATFQASSVPDENIDKSDTSIMDPVSGVSKRVNFFDASGAVLSEFYVQYKLANTTVKIGRQFIHTPLVSSGWEGKSSEAIIKDAFEAYVISNTDLPQTTLTAGYVDKFQAQSNGSSKPGDFEDVEDGAYMVHVKNTSIQNLTLQAQYLEIDGKSTAGDKEALYFQADYHLKGHTLSAQYLASTDKSQPANAQDGKIYGLKATGPLGVWKFGYLVAFNSSTDKDAAIYTGAGEGATDVLFSAMPVHDGGVPSRPDTDTLVGGLVVPVAGATLIGYGGKSMSETHVLGDVTAMGGMVIYPAMKNLLVRMNYEHVEVEHLLSEDTDTVRVYLSYKF